MKLKAFVLILVTCGLMTACGNSASGSGGNAANGSSGASGTSAFQAEANSSVSVALSWAPVEGASQYSLELSFGGDFFPVANLAADQTSYEDFPVPDNTELSYRLKALSGTETLAEETLKVTTPATDPNPLTVQANEFLPASPLGDLSNLVTDPNDPNFDPNAFVLPGIDPETGEVDLSALMGEPTGVSADIGAEGGLLSVTDPNGVVYTLMIPAGALEDTTTITMTPVESIDDLPLDTFLAAVDILPQGLPLEIPGLLTFAFPEEVSTPDGMVTMNFGYEGGGDEFFFVPYNESGDQTAWNAAGAGHLAAALRPFKAGPLSGINIPQLGSRGVGQGSPAKVRSTVKTHASSRGASQRSSQQAAAQMEDDLAPLVVIEDELAPLIPEHQLKAVHEISQKIDAAGDATQLAAAISDFELYMYNFGDQPTLRELNEQLWSKLLEKTRQEFEKNRDQCLTKQAFAVQAIGQKMLSASGGFWKTFADRFRNSFGNELIDNIAALIRKCKLEFDLDSHIRTEADSGDITQAHVKANFPLKFTLSPTGQPVLTGQGAINYQGAPLVNWEGCEHRELTLNDVTGSKVRIWAIYPQFDESGSLTQLWMDSYTMSGKQKSLSVRCDDSSGYGAATNGQTGDLWGGMFVYANFPNILIRDWKVNPLSPDTQSSGILGEWRHDVTGSSSFGGDYIDQTTMLIIKNPGGP